METVFAHADTITFTENHIKQLHCDLLIDSAKDERHRGAYKTRPNNVSAFDAEGKEVGPVDYVAAAALYRTCRQRGHTVRKLIDCLIAAVAIRGNVPVLHMDVDFDILAQLTTLQVDAV